MKSLFGVALLVGCFLAAGSQLCAGSNGGQSGSSPSQPAPGAQNPAPAQQQAPAKPPTNANPFPEDTSSVPVMPTRVPSGVAPGDEEPSTHAPMPPEDGDPVRSPEDSADAADSSSSSSSSSLAGMGDLNPPDDDTDTTHPGKRKKKGEEVVPEHHETAAEDEEVGSYYLTNKDWKGALSRFQSALVLDPDNPDVYWGLAESERHTGDFADARANYKKVMEYDPGSHHAKEAAKALEDPEIANAKPDAAKPDATATQPQQ